MTTGMQSFSYQSWEPEDRPVFPGVWPIRKEMEGTQDVLSYRVSQHTVVLFTGSFFTSLLPLLKASPMMERVSLLRFSITCSTTVVFYILSVQYDLTSVTPPDMCYRDIKLQFPVLSPRTCHRPFVCTHLMGN